MYREIAIGKTNEAIACVMSSLSLSYERSVANECVADAKDSAFVKYFQSVPLSQLKRLRLEVVDCDSKRHQNRNHDLKPELLAHKHDTEV